MFPVNYNGASQCLQSRPHLGSHMHVSPGETRMAPVTQTATWVGSLLLDSLFPVASVFVVWNFTRLITIMNNLFCCGGGVSVGDYLDLVGEHSASVYSLFGAAYLSLGCWGYFGVPNVALINNLYHFDMTPHMMIFKWLRSCNISWVLILAKLTWKDYWLCIFCVDACRGVAYWVDSPIKSRQILFKIFSDESTVIWTYIK